MEHLYQLSESICDNRIYLDIHPENDKVSKVDYLEEFDETALDLNDNGKVHVVGNPPFWKTIKLSRL